MFVTSADTAVYPSLAVEWLGFGHASYLLRDAMVKYVFKGENLDRAELSMPKVKFPTCSDLY